MNKPLAIILLVILAIVLVLLLRVLIPAFTNYLKNLPKGIFILLFVAIIAVMVYLIYFLISSAATGGEMGKTPEDEITVQEENKEVVLEAVENCIILREDSIWINNVLVTMDYAEKYIDEHVESNTPIVIVDDYSLSSLHHEITELCDKKGVNYSTEDEKGNKQ